MNNKQAQFAVVVPAAGVGKRMVANCPKQYLTLNDKTVLEQTVNRLLSHPKISQVIIALGEHDEYFSDLPLATNPNVQTVVGGKERCDSVLSGLLALSTSSSTSTSAKEHSWVLVHDAARPCITHQDIDKLIAHCLSTSTGAILATPVRDTMKRTTIENAILHTEERNNLWHALTPQMYPLAQLTSALTQALAQNVAITDESSAIEWAGKISSVVEGRDDNIKITRPNDLSLASFYLHQQEQNSL